MFAKPRIEKILFATDLSKNAEHAFGYAASMAEAYNARLTVLHVMEKMAPNAELLLATFMGISAVDEFRQKSEADRIVELKARIKQFCTESVGGMTACRFMLDQVMVEPGQAVESILHHVAAGDYDALVMGSRGHGLVTEALMGGTSRKVIVQSPIPVFVIPMGSSAGVT